MIVKHLYQRSVRKNGKVTKVWYFWFWHNGKQIRRSCGTSIKRDAMAYIESIADKDLIDSKIENKQEITLCDFAKEMFSKDSSYLLKLKNRGVVFTEKTLYQKNKYLSYILERFGEYPIERLNSGIIDDWLLRQDRSNSWRNNVLAVFRAIFSELYLYQVIDKIPELIKYKRIDVKSKGILYPNEIKFLFPDDVEKLRDVWNVWKGENKIQDIIFATLIYTTLTTGMRSGEIRALKYSQFIREDAILLNAMIDSSGNRISHLKKGDEKNRKWRIAILPERTVQMIKYMKELEGNKKSDFVFEHRGELFQAEYLNRHFQRVLVKNGIDVKSRNITLHSLRFTYNTMMKREISADDLRLMIGHSSQSMTEYYDKSAPIDHLQHLLENKVVIDSVWN